MDKSEGASITTVVCLLLLLAIGIGWCLFAAEYAKDVEGWKAGGADFVPGRRAVRAGMIYAVLSLTHNGIVQLPNLFAVIQFSIYQRTMASIGFGAILLLIVIFGAGLKILERRMERPRRGGRFT